MCDIPFLFGLGFGDLRFGDTAEDAERHFGKADQADELEGLDDTITIVWHYWEKGFSLFFDQEAGNRFSCVEFEVSEETRLFDQAIAGMTERELKTLFKANGFSDLDEEMLDWGEKRISFDDAQTDCYFEKGKIISINSGVSLPHQSVPLILPN